MGFLVAFALLLSVIALIRANAADQRAEQLRREGERLAQRIASLERASGITQGAESRGTAAPPEFILAEDVPELTQWPEEAFSEALETDADFSRSPKAVSRPAPRRKLNLWGPEFSQARISISGGALVLGGLAFVLWALGLPAWTLLLAVFAFGALLYGTGRLVPWPVSGALRGLGYGVTALGLGSLAQKLPAGWVTALNHWHEASWADVFLVRVPQLSALAWAAFGALALMPAAVLRQQGWLGWRPRQPLSLAPWTLLPVAAVVLLPQLLTAGAMRVMLQAGPHDPLSRLMPFALTAMAGAMAALLWRERRTLGWAEDSVGGTVSSALVTAGSSYAAGLALSLLGANTQPIAFAGLALVLLSLGLSGQSRLWKAVGAAGLALTAYWGLQDFGGVRASPSEVLLSALPALMGVWGAWRLSRRPVQPDGSDAALLGGWCGFLLAGLMATAQPIYLTVWTVALVAAVWAVRLLPRLQAARNWWGAALLPGLLVAALGLLLREGRVDAALVVLVGLTLLQGSLLWPKVGAALEVAGLGGLALGLSRTLLPPQPVLALPLALAFTAALSGRWRLHLPMQRVDGLLLAGAGASLLGAGAVLWDDVPTSHRLLLWVGALLLPLVWAWLRGRRARQSNTQTVLGALLAALALNLLSLFPDFTAVGFMLASLLLLGLGLSVSMSAHTLANRSRWSVGLGLVLAAGGKAVMLDSLFYSNVAVAGGLAILVTGVGLLMLAVVAPRPAAEISAAPFAKSEEAHPDAIYTDDYW